MMKEKLLIALLLYSINLLGQKPSERIVSMDYNQVKIVEILNDISLGQGITFSYSNLIPTSEIISIQVKNVTMLEAVSKIFENLPVTPSFTGNRVVLKYTDLRQTVRGTIIDRHTQMPIIGASIILNGSDPLVGAITDVDGKFRLENIQVGRKAFSVSYVGYESEQVSNVLIGTGKETVLDVEIIESVIKMEEVIISAFAPGNPPLNGLAVVSGRSFTTEETKRFAMSIGDPGRLASAYAGVSSGDDGTNELVIRGNSPRGVLWRLEGVEIPSPSHFSSEGSSSGGISMFSTNVMARSDFFTGAFPAQYGNALSGVFDINLRRGNNEKREYTLQAGLLGLDVATEGPFQKGKESSYLFNYRYSTLAILAKAGLVVQGENETNIFQDLSFKINLPTRKFGQFSIFGLGGISEFKENDPGITDIEAYDMGVVGISNLFPINNSTYLKSVVAFSGTRIHDEFILENLPDTSNFSRTSDVTKSYTTFSTSLNKKLNARHMFEAGVLYRMLSYNFQNLSLNSFNQPPYTDYSLYSEDGNSGMAQGYFSWKYRPTENLDLIGGLHSMYFKFNNEVSFEPRVGFKWQFIPNQSISGSIGVHSRIESLEYYLGQITNDDGTTSQLNTDLGFTKAIHYVMGYENRLNPYTFLKTEIYYQDLFDVPVWTNQEEFPFSTILVTNGFTVLPLDNTGTAKNYGIELTLERVFAKGYYLLANGSIYEAKYTAKDGIERNSRYNGNFTNNILGGKEWKVGKNGKNNIFGINIKSSWSGNKRYTPIDLVQSIADGQEVRPKDGAFTAQYPDYYRMDIQVMFRRNKPKYTSEWRLDIQNLTNRENILEDFYSNSTQSIQYEYQLQRIPLISYRIEF